MTKQTPSAPGATYKRQPGRPATGSLVWTKQGWSARFMATVDGERIRVQHPLETTSKAAAQAKLARLVAADSPTSDEARRPETFEEAARRIVATQAREGLASWKDRLARLERFAFPAFGGVRVTELRPSHIRTAVDAAFQAGKAKGTTQKLLVDCSTILGELWRDELITENPAARVRVPKGAPVNDRERVVLSDAEFEAFMACPDIDPELHTMSLASRTFGGMRTSDLHAWDWGHIDTARWLDAHVPRPKTKSKDRLGLPEVLLPVLQAWWDAKGRPTSGPVFPIRRGKRAGERKRGKISYAKALREALWQAGIVRPLPGFDEATTDEQRRPFCLIQAGSENYLPLDFHSFRRAYNTGLARAGVNVQTAMRLAGHRNPSTHMRYVMNTESLSAPSAALPAFLPPSEAKPKSPSPVSPRLFSVPGKSRTCDQRFRNTTEPPPLDAPGVFGAWPSDRRRLATIDAAHRRQSPAPETGAALFDAALADACLAFALRGLASRIGLSVAADAAARGPAPLEVGAS